MAKPRVHSIEFKRHLVAEYAIGETLHVFAKRHDCQRRPNFERRLTAPTG